MSLGWSLILPFLNAFNEINEIAKYSMIDVHTGFGDYCYINLPEVICLCLPAPGLFILIGDPLLVTLAALGGEVLGSLLPVACETVKIKEN